MALVVYVFQFKGKKNHLHLALELTNVNAQSDECGNYISFYAYKGSSTQLSETAQFGVQGTGTTMHRACFIYKSVYFLKNFGFSNKQEDFSNLQFIEKIVIATKQDGYETSPYDESIIAKEWQAMRLGKLTSGKIVTHIDKQGKSNDEMTFQINCPFQIDSRHCGTIVSNALNSTLLHEAQPEDTTIKHYVTKSLQNTIKLAKQIQQNQIQSIAANSDKFISYDRLKNLYKEYRKTKFFLASDSAEMKLLSSLLKNCAGLPHISLNKISEIFSNSNLDHYLSSHKSTKKAFDKDITLLSSLKN